MSTGPALRDLVTADPGAWLRRAGTWDGLSRALSERAAELERSAPRSWTGADADAAALDRAEQVRRLRDDAGTATRAAQVLGTHAGEVLDAQRRLVLAALAVHPQFVVDLERGTLSAGVGAHWLGVWQLPAMVARFGADLAHLSTAVADAVGAATRSDHTTAAALDALRPAPAAAPRPVAPAAPPRCGRRRRAVLVDGAARGATGTAAAHPARPRRWAGRRAGRRPGPGEPGPARRRAVPAPGPGGTARPGRGHRGRGPRPTGVGRSGGDPPTPRRR
ncbi:hypothetical protein [Pseudonocardia sp. HH130629-09]|uniref:hypothetical protein n=1 Tax=Pseudonocardia sp. HH130629-09 TaxID=1641402 RepID=UPI000A9E5C32|nr:hypothetical protein [Pseudonocardia sp. HH130629-09]